MTIGSNVARQSFNCNGTTTLFPVNIQAYLATDFLVLYTSAAGVITPLTLNSDYTLTAASGSASPSYWNLTTQSGQFTSPYASGTIQVILNPTQTQQTAYPSGQAFPSTAVQQNIDRLTQMVLRLQDQVSRAIRIPDGDSTGTTQLLPAAASRALTYSAFDGNGNAIAVTNLPVATGLNQTNLGAVFRPALATEVGVVNGWLDYFNVDRYGTNTIPGTTPMATAVQNAVTSCLNSGGGEVTYGGKGGPYYLGAPINCTWQTSGAPGVRFRNLSPSTSQQHGFILGHNSIGFDCTGNDTIDMSDVVITTPIPIGSNPQPTIGILFARNVTKGGLHNQAKNVQITGCFSVAGIYNYGSEQFNLDYPWIYNYSLTPTAKAFIVTANNISNVQSIATCTTPGPNLGLNLIATGTQSMTIVDVRAPSFFMGGKSLGQDCVYLEGAAGYHQQGGWSANQQGRAIIAVDNSLAGTAAYTPTSWVSIRDLKIEHFGATAIQPEYGIYFGASAGAVTTHTGWVVSGVHFDTAVAALATADGNTTLDGLHWDSCSEEQSNGLHITGILQGYSTLLLGASVLNLGTINNSWILGVPANINITNNTGGGYVFPMGVASYAGWGTPTGAILTPNFPGASATLVQTSETLAYLINILKVWGLIGT